MRFLTQLGWISLFTISATAMAHDYKQGEIRIDHPYARPTVASQSSGAVYLNIENLGKKAEQLVSVTSSAAKSAEIHTMTMDGNVMKMREVNGIDIKPGEKISMVPGKGYHIMLIGLKQPLKAGDKFPVTLSFRHAGKIETQFWVEEKKPDSKSQPAAHHH